MSLIPPQTPRSMRITGPETGDVVGEVALHDDGDAVAALERDSTARTHLAAHSAHARADILQTEADRLIKRAETAANLIAGEGISHAIAAMSEPKITCFRW